MEIAMGKGTQFSRRDLAEGMRACILLGDFESERSRAWELLDRMSAQTFSRQALISLASIFSLLIDVPLKRDYTRRKDLIVKWLDMNYEAVEPWVPYITVEHMEPRENRVVKIVRIEGE
jgi:hypothetical protein